jgi:squalene-hopene/tetraprenyl-beta-curcumene cyclase
MHDILCTRHSAYEVLMRLAITIVVTILVTGLTARGIAPQDAPPERTGWNQEGAARYLDERMDTWFTNAKKLQTSQGETSCVSCHTSIPYALSRSVLRRAMHVNSATPQEARLLQEVTRRVETYDTHELQYDFNEAKKAESRGTEAVLNTLILARADAEQNRRDASEPTRKALRRLWETQRSDGAWDWLSFGLEPFESIDGAYYGATLAALAIGTAPASARQATDAAAGIDKLRGYLKEKYPMQSLFNRVWLLLASTRLKDLLTREQREALISEIQSRHRDDGGWSLETLGTWRWNKADAPFLAPGTPDATLLAKSDGYATGLIVHALREAGLPVDHPTVKKGLRWLRANQQDVEVNQRTLPAWRAHSLNYDREHGGEKGEPVRRLFMSDSATAFAVLALAGSD